MSGIAKNLPVRLTDEELRRYGDLLAMKTKELDDLKATIKHANADFREQREAIEGELLRLAEAIEQRQEMREVACREERDIDRGEVSLIRMDTNEAVSVRAMDPAERQTTLEFPKAVE